MDGSLRSEVSCLSLFTLWELLQQRGEERGREGEGGKGRGRKANKKKHAIIIKEEEGKVHVTLEPTRKAVPLVRSSLCEWQRVWVHSCACRELRRSLFCSLFVIPGPGPGEKGIYSCFFLLRADFPALGAALRSRIRVLLHLRTGDVHILYA